MSKLRPIEPGGTRRHVPGADGEVDRHWGPSPLESRVLAAAAGDVAAMTQVGFSNAAIARQLTSTAPASPSQNFTPAQPDGPTTIPTVTIVGEVTREAKQAKVEVTEAMDLLIHSFLLYKTNLGGACSLFQKLIETPAVKEAVFDTSNVMKKGWEKARTTVLDGVVGAIGKEVPFAKETLDTGRLVIEDLDRSLAAMQALDRFKVVEHFQRAAFNRIDGLAKRAKGQDAVFDILTKLDDDDAKALEGARQIRTKAQAQFDATPSIDDIYRDLAIAYVGESFSQREEGFFFKDTITTGKVFVEIRLDESGNERFKSARLAAPGADRLADAFFPGGGALDLLTAPLRRQVKVEMRGDMTEYYEEPLLGRTITYELDPGARTLAGSTTTEVGTDAGAGPTNVAAYNPSQILVKRGEMRFIPEEKS